MPRKCPRNIKAKQAALVADHISKQDIVITTALIPGRPAPRLVTKAMLSAMRAGSVVVDLAVERGGNVEGAEAGKVVTVGGVKIVGHNNVPGRIAASSSLLYAKNLFSFLETMVAKETKVFAINPEDELVKATLLTHGGNVVHAAFALRRRPRLQAALRMKAEGGETCCEKACCGKSWRGKTCRQKEG